MLEHSSDVLLAVLLLPGEVAECLLPQGGVLLSVPLTHSDHLPVLLVLHVIVHDLLEPWPGKGTPQWLPWKITWILPFPWKSPDSQLPLLIEIKDSVLEVMHLTQDQRLVKDIAETAALQQGDGLRMKLLFDLGKEGKISRPLGTSQ